MIHFMSQWKYLVLFFIFIFGFILKTLSDAGEFKTLDPHFSCDCLPIPGVVGAEDITFLKNGTALISSDDRRGSYLGKDIQELSLDIRSRHLKIHNHRSSGYQSL